MIRRRFAAGHKFAAQIGSLLLFALVTLALSWLFRKSQLLSCFDHLLSVTLLYGAFCALSYEKGLITKAANGSAFTSVWKIPASSLLYGMVCWLAPCMVLILIKGNSSFLFSFGLCMLLGAFFLFSNTLMALLLRLFARSGRLAAIGHGLLFCGLIIGYSFAVYLEPTSMVITLLITHSFWLCAFLSIVLILASIGLGFLASLIQRPKVHRKGRQKSARMPCGTGADRFWSVLKRNPLHALDLIEPVLLVPLLFETVLLVFWHYGGLHRIAVVSDLMPGELMPYAFLAGMGVAWSVLAGLCFPSGTIRSMIKKTGMVKKSLYLGLSCQLISSTLFCLVLHQAAAYPIWMDFVFVSSCTLSCALLNLFQIWCPLVWPSSWIASHLFPYTAGWLLLYAMCYWVPVLWLDNRVVMIIQALIVEGCLCLFLLQNIRLRIRLHPADLSDL